MKNVLRQSDDDTRRQFMLRAAQACLGVSLAPWLTRQAAAEGSDRSKSGGKAQRAIYLFLEGGMSHLDTLDPKPGKSEVMGKTETIATNVPDIQFGHWLPRLAHHADKMSLLRAVTSTQGAHDPAQYLARTSYKQVGTVEHPALGAWAARMRGAGNIRLPGSVYVGGGSRHPGGGYLDTKYEPLPIGDPALGLQDIAKAEGVSDDQFTRRLDKLQKFNAAFRTRYQRKDVRGYAEFYKDAVELMHSEDAKAFDLSHEDEKTRDLYGDNSFGQGCLLARRLAERDVRFVEVSSGGWDNHNQIYENLPPKAEELDVALSALIADLDQRGMLDTTLVVVISEFGRSAKFSPTVGRSHHPAVFTGLLVGGGVKGGFVYGASDEVGQSPAENAIGIQDFNATVLASLGINVAQEIVSPIGRPFTPTDGGRPVAEVFV